MRRPRRPAQELRLAIDCLPVETKEAMLAGISTNDIIVGAYTDGAGGVCPMLAAHRNGGRTSFAAFARAWDRYTGARKRARRASERELRMLVTALEVSLAKDALRTDLDLGTAAREHREAQARYEREPGGEIRVRRRLKTGERNRAAELQARRGWAWLRPVRRLDEYEQALRELEELAPERDREYV